MFKALLARARQGHRTIALSRRNSLPAAALSRATGTRSRRNASTAAAACSRCVPDRGDAGCRPRGRGSISGAASSAAIAPRRARRTRSLHHDWRLAASERAELLHRGRSTSRMSKRSAANYDACWAARCDCARSAPAAATAARPRSMRSATSSSTASRFGIDFVASPRHADGVLITGPITENMREQRCAPTRRSPSRSSSSPPVPARSRAVSSAGISRRATASRACFRSISTCPDAHLTPSPSSTACCACSVGYKATARWAE